jgi:hypothetical protein
VNISLDKEKYQEEQERWLAERIINAQWWRCAKCLLKRYIAEDGWICPKCTINCEETRIRAREKLPPCSKTPPEEALTYRAVSWTPKTDPVEEINSVSRSIRIVANAMERVWSKMKIVLGCFALHVREMSTRRSVETSTLAWLAYHSFQYKVQPLI